MCLAAPVFGEQRDRESGGRFIKHRSESTPQACEDRPSGCRETVRATAEVSGWRAEGLECVVRVPTEQTEDVRNIGRGLDVLTAERTMHSNRIKGLLVQQGIVIKNVISKKFLNKLEMACRWDGQKVSGDFKARIVREHERLRLYMNRFAD